MVFCCIQTSFAQENMNQKIRIYDTWISLKSTPGSVRGVLYQIEDSSILVSQSKPFQDSPAHNDDPLKIYVNDINVLKARRQKSIIRGAVIGSISGFAIGTIATAIGVRGNGIFTAGTALYVGIYAGGIGFGAGALAGLIKDRIPIKGSFENLNLYRGTLQDYSYLKENNFSVDLFEHKGFLGFSSGPAFPLGEFGIYSQDTENDNTPKIGSGGSLFLGYRFTEKIGLSVTNLFNTYSIGKDEAETYWEVGGYIIGPMFSVHVNDKLFVDLKPGIGFAATDLVVENEFAKNGIGLGMNLSASVSYNISKRWCLLAETRYFYCHSKFDEGSRGKFQTFSMEFGIAYRFGKTSL